MMDGLADDQAARERAHFPAQAADLLRARSLAQDYRHLAVSLRPGQRVLDVGCGTCALTAGMAELARPGEVGGRRRRHEPPIRRGGPPNARGVPNLSFRCADVYALGHEASCDVVVAARVLQWLDRPQEAVRQMVAALNPGGRLFVLDDNHLKARLSPPPPPAMRQFRERSLAWRADAGMDNEMADHLPELLRRAGLIDVEVVEQHEVTRRGDPDFERRIRLWGVVAATRGRQVVAAGFISEEERRAAVEAFEAWVAGETTEQAFYLLSVVGTKLRA